MSDLLIIIGAGGHASVLIDALLSQKVQPDYLVSPEDPSREIFSGIRRLSRDDDVFQLEASCLLVNGIGSLPGQAVRKKVGDLFSSRGFIFRRVISDHAVVSPYARLGEGVQVMAGAIIQAGAVIGDHSIINTGAIIDHDCQIGCYNHIAPGVTLSGQVSTGDNVHIGTGASVIQSVSIGESSIIGAGAIVTGNIGDGVKVLGFRSLNK